MVGHVLSSVSLRFQEKKTAFLTNLQAAVVCSLPQSPAGILTLVRFPFAPVRVSKVVVCTERDLSLSGLHDWLCGNNIVFNQDEHNLVQVKRHLGNNSLRKRLMTFLLQS